MTSLTDVVGKRAAPVPTRKTNGHGGGNNHFERARAYVAKMPPAISGSGGHVAAWNVARKCAQDFGLDYDETLTILLEYNDRCEPPWSAKELAHKAKDACEKAHTSAPVEDRERHWKMPESHYQTNGNEITTPEPPDDAQPLFEEDEYRGGGPKEDYERQHRELPTASEPLRGLKHLSKVAVVGRERFAALAREPVDYVWQDIAVAGTIVGIAGAPGGGKTTLLFLLLVARMNTGAPVGLLGRIVTPAPKGQFTVLIEGEHGEASAARKIIQSFELQGIDLEGLDRLILVARKAVRLESPEWSDVVKLIECGLVSDIAIDTVARVAPANPDSEQEQVAIFDLVARAIDRAPEDLKPTAWAVMHTRKNGTGGLEDVSGSAQRTGQADTVMILRPDKASGRVASVEVTFEKLREAPDEYPEPAAFTITKAADGSLMLVQDAASQADKERPLEARICDLLMVRPRTKSELAETLRRSRKHVDDALTVLFEGRHICTATVKVKGVDRKAFALSTPKPTPDSTPDSRLSI